MLPSFAGPPLISPMVNPGEMNHMVPLRGIEDSDELVPFHFYNPEDIIYDESKKRAKIIEGRYLKGELLGEGGILEG